MRTHPILASLRKHRIPAILIVLEIALACAVFCNAVFMISQRVAEIHLPNAMDEQGVSVVSVRGTDPAHAGADMPRDLAALREIPGVRAAAAINALPLDGNGWNSNIATGTGQLLQNSSPNVSTYLFTRGGPEALGLRLLHGRFFDDGEYADGQVGSNYLPTGHAVLMTQSLARRMWPDQSALGKQIWIGDEANYTVVGVIADVLRPAKNGQGLTGFDWAIFFPVAPHAILDHYVVRSSPRDSARIARQAVAKIVSLSPNAVVAGKPFTAIRHAFFDDARSMVWMLMLVCVVMLAVTAFGIVGLTSFWVRQRRRQIGVRRAVGATRNQILRYFQAENFLLTTAGVGIGLVLAFGINLYLMQHYPLNRMPWYYLPISAGALWVLGQLAVLGPALRASNVPPVVATRGV